MNAHTPTFRPEVRYIQNMRKLGHAHQADIGDMIEVMDMIRCGDLTHIDEGAEAADRADRIEAIDPVDLLDGEPCEFRYRHSTDPDDFGADLVAVRLGDLWLTRAQAVAMLGREKVERIESIATCELEAAE